MNCRLEENNRILEILHYIKCGYEIGDFEELFKYLAPDCVMNSQWVLNPNEGYDAVVEYYTKKGQALKTSESKLDSYFVELVGHANPEKNVNVILPNGTEDKGASIALWYTPGKPCLYMEQTIKDETHGILIDIALNDSGMVKKIDICMPELFNYRSIGTYADFTPSVDDEEKDAASIYIGESYYNELYLFFDCAGEQFDEYGDLRIPMDKWCAILDYWKSYLDTKTFDEAFELLAGVNYENNEVARPYVANKLCRAAKAMWSNRENSAQLLNGLLEWTELYKNTHNYVLTCGW